VLEREGRLNPDRVRMRIGRVLGVIGVLLVIVGFASFIYTGFRASQSASSGFPVPVLAAFVVFACGGVLGAIGAGLVRAGRAKGL
jgi:formate-dependent nitrite reductase membrane component NrfD